MDLIAEFKSEMKKHFDMSDIGLLSYFLGMEVMQDEHGIFVTSNKYTQDLLKRFNMHNYCKAALTPMCVNDKFQAADSSGDTKIYRSLVGQLI